MTKTLNQKIAEADHFASLYLGNANEAAEKGCSKKAEKLYAKCQFWLDRLNKLTGNG
jgi:hypothetical protein